MSFQLQLKLDLKKLYNELCEECKKKLIKVLKEGLSDDIILAAIGIQETKKAPPRRTRRTSTTAAEAIPPPES